jgi:hypothetical protein
MSSKNASVALNRPAHSRTFDSGLDYASANVIRIRPRPEPLPGREQQPDHAALDLVRRLRPLLQLSLLQPRNDWDQACLLIAASRGAAVERYACAFFHGLEVHGSRGWQFFANPAESASGDEMWIARLILKLQVEDEANASYLIATRIKPAGRRRMLFLASGLARSLAGDRHHETSA